MVQLRILSENGAGAFHSVRRFPCVVGRSSNADLRVEAPGVWDRHIQLELIPAKGIALSVLPGALASVNGRPSSRELLHNGDLIDLGGAKLQFWLSQTRQRSLKAREILTWAGLALLSLLQVAIVYQLLR